MQRDVPERVGLDLDDQDCLSFYYYVCFEELVVTDIQSVITDLADKPLYGSSADTQPQGKFSS